MMERTTLFIDVILPLALPQRYTYRVPFDLNEHVLVGQRVVVQLGKSKLYTAIVRSVHSTPPSKYEAKYIDSILDVTPIVNQKQLELWEWMAKYYMCTVGEVMNAALPSGLKLSSETKILLNPAYTAQSDEQKSLLEQSLSDKEFLIAEALQLREVISIQEASEIVGLKIAYPIIKSLLEKNVVLVEEELKDRFKAKVEQYVRLSEQASSEEKLKEIFDKLEKKAFKQLQVLMAFIKLSERYSNFPKAVKKKELLNESGAGASVLNDLVKKQVLEIYELEIDRLGTFASEGKTVNLSEQQEKAYQKINSDFSKKEVVLLQGVTSSGKTEIYVKLIADVLARGKQVLYLLPEIALTTQIINRIRKFFGEVVGVYHSKFSENERVEVWNKVLAFQPNDPAKGTLNSEAVNKLESPDRIDGLRTNSNYQLIIGARSALFLPYADLGLIIVDEEHDTSYKQYDPAPRYNARDSALFLAQVHRSKTLLGSATPALESYFNATQNKYGYVQLTERFGGVQLPEILLADVQEAKKRKEMKSHFTPLLLNHIQMALENKEQVILFQNRRGFAPMLECNTCAWVPQCTQCDVSLTYHKNVNLLKCHYCGFSTKPPTACEACGSTEMLMKGFGTEKIEEELAIFFPTARIARMDLDTTRSKYAYQQIIQSFEEQQVDVLVGTQMVTKGLDFDHVSVVGILNADSMLHFPDFRSFERSYQLMAQVSGRAGRKDKRGKVIIQTHTPNHQVIRTVIENSWEEFYTAQLLERKNYLYPPFYRLIKLTLKHKDANILNNAAADYADQLRLSFAHRVLGPEFPAVSRVRNYFLKNILIKLEKEISIQQSKQKIAALSAELKQIPEYKSIVLVADVDPV
ncbi:MAG: primosomal protein N' [Bacteroidetes bacterium]|nr:primosomal protein N' [Bacteroidota bacterium]